MEKEWIYVGILALVTVALIGFYKPYDVGFSDEDSDEAGDAECTCPISYRSDGGPTFLKKVMETSESNPNIAYEFTNPCGWDNICSDRTCSIKVSGSFSSSHIISHLFDIRIASGITRSNTNTINKEYTEYGTLIGFTLETTCEENTKSGT